MARDPETDEQAGQPADEEMIGEGQDEFDELDDEEGEDDDEADTDEE
jgi:hypothetical protein